jgi:hypothetical protein
MRPPATGQGIVRRCCVDTLAGTGSNGCGVPLSSSLTSLILMRQLTPPAPIRPPAQGTRNSLFLPPMPPASPPPCPLLVLLHGAGKGAANALATLGPQGLELPKACTCCLRLVPESRGATWDVIATCMPGAAVRTLDACAVSWRQSLSFRTAVGCVLLSSTCRKQPWLSLPYVPPCTPSRHRPHPPVQTRVSPP